MRQLIIIISFLFIEIGVLSAQQYESVLRDIEQNNTELKALRAHTDAVKLESHKNIHLDNPEVEFGYLWGTPSSMGNRIDLDVTQQFDFPSTYYYKKKIAEGKEKEAELEYATYRREVLNKARQLCISLIFSNVMQAEFNHHIETAKAIKDAYQRMFDAGEKGILDLNKAKLDLLKAHNEYENNRIERETILAELQQLNGGIKIKLEDTTYPIRQLPEDFDTWYQNIEAMNPNMQRLNTQMDINAREIQLSKSQWAPNFGIGYKSERILGTTLQGIGVSMSIPLWQNRYSVKTAKAQKVALETAIYDVHTQYYCELKNQYSKALHLQELLKKYNDILQSVNTDALLKKALEKGEISLVEYIMERNVYHEALHDSFEAERDFQLSVAALMAYTE